MDEIEIQLEQCNLLEEKINYLIQSLGNIPIGTLQLMPLGWRKAAKGRTVWRILEEIITQNLEVKAKSLGFVKVTTADSEVDVFDMTIDYLQETKNTKLFINIKSAVVDGKKNKDDISKANGIKYFYENATENLYIATFYIRFNDDMTITITNCVVCPINWIPDIYINPSNNGNLQSADYKYKNKFIKRTRQEFFEQFLVEYQNAINKKKKRTS